MTNFFTKSKDVYYDNPANYPHFADVFETIKETSIMKNYYQTDLFNIEEILSILEMREFLEGVNSKQSFCNILLMLSSITRRK